MKPKEALTANESLPGREDYFVWDEGIEWNPSAPESSPELVDQDPFPRATGAEIMQAKSKIEKEESLGPLAAQLLEEGRIEITDLVQFETTESGQEFITQKPVSVIFGDSPPKA